MATHPVTFRPQLPSLVPSPQSLFADAQHLSGELDGRHLVFVVFEHAHAQRLFPLAQGVQDCACAGEQYWSTRHGEARSLVGAVAARPLP